jgi:hypothetical protein
MRAQDPDARPTFDQLLKQLKAFQRDMANPPAPTVHAVTETEC